MCYVTDNILLSIPLLAIRYRSSYSPHHTSIELPLPGGAPASGYSTGRGRSCAEVTGFKALGLGDARDVVLSGL